MSWTLIEHQTLTSSVASVTLGNGGTLPQTFKTLVLMISARSNGSGLSTAIAIYPNNSTSSLTVRTLYGDGASATSYSGTDGWTGNAVGSTATASTFSNIAISLPNYSGSTNKPYSSDSVTENNGTNAYQTLHAGLWSNTAAITSVVLSSLSGSFVSGSTFTLYGLK